MNDYQVGSSVAEELAEDNHVAEEDTSVSARVEMGNIEVDAQGRLIFDNDHVDVSSYRPQEGAFAKDSFAAAGSVEKSLDYSW